MFRYLIAVANLRDLNAMKLKFLSQKALIALDCMDEIYIVDVTCLKVPVLVKRRKIMTGNQNGITI